MKAFLKNLWRVFVKIIKWIWNKIYGFLSKFKYKIKFVFRGIEGDNKPGNLYWVIIPTPYFRILGEILEIGIIAWLGLGIKLVITKKQTPTPSPTPIP